MPAQSILEMATREGAAALGILDKTGTLEPGKKADITVVDLRRLHTTGGDDPVARLVYSARADDVDTVLVDGRILKRGGQLTIADPEETTRKAVEALESLRRRLQ
jgi:5-methylthioadenosine/S-adenosylhomocysteine deaminase